MDWYRRYHGTCADPKMRLVARSAGVPTPFAIAAWDAVLEHASAHEERGSVQGLNGELLAVTIDCSDEEGERLLTAFRKRGMINALDRVAAWDKRQPSDPTAAERMKRYRERKKAAAEEHGPNGDDAKRHDERNDRNASPDGRNALPQNRTEKNRTESDTDSLSAAAESYDPRARGDVGAGAPPAAAAAAGPDPGSGHVSEETILELHHRVGVMGTTLAALRRQIDLLVHERGSAAAVQLAIDKALRKAHGDPLAYATRVVMAQVTERIASIEAAKAQAMAPPGESEADKASRIFLEAVAAMETPDALH
jgi:hypothetical protein